MWISELARRSGVPPKTLRFYEEVGVLEEPERTAAGYRDYGPEALDRLAFVRAAQAAGLTLAEIREVISIREEGSPPCRHVAELVDRKRAEVRTQLAELRRLSRQLDELAERARGFEPEACRSDVICELLTELG